MKFKIMVLALSLAVFLSSCNFAGLHFDQKNKYFQCYKSPNFDSTKYTDVGVYVFSDGGKQNAQSYIGNFDENSYGLTGLLNFGFYYYLTSYRSKIFHFSKYVFPDVIERNSVFEPDSINSGPSLELSDNLVKKLSDMGYNATAVTDFGHSREVSLKSCLENAKGKGYQIAFIVYYSGISHWSGYINGAETSSQEFDSVGVFEGYLYLPNVAAYDVNTGELLWSNFWYGLIQYTHTFNLSGEPYNICVDKAIIYNGAKDYISASTKTVDIIFKPPYFKKSYIPFPTKIPEQLKKRI